MRINLKDLAVIIKALNDETSNPHEYAQPRVEGKPFRANIGNYHLSREYGTCSLRQVVSHGGGVRSVFTGCTRRELYDRIQAKLSGIRLAKEA